MRAMYVNQRIPQSINYLILIDMAEGNLPIPSFRSLARDVIEQQHSLR